MSTITWKTEKRKVKDLRPAEYNPRKISDKGRSDLERSVDKFGRVEPLVVNLDGTVIGGHQRLVVYAAKGVEDVEVMIPSRKLNKVEEKELNLRLNKNMGEWDWSKLGVFGEGFLLEVGFDLGELRVGLGLSDSGDVDIDDSRMEVLTVLPPESPQLRERVQVHFEDKKDYDRVKKYIEDNGYEEIVKAIKKLIK